MAASEEVKKVLVALKNNTEAECKAALHWAITTFVKPGVDQVVLGHVLKYPDLIPTASKCEQLPRSQMGGFYCKQCPLCVQLYLSSETMLLLH